MKPRLKNDVDNVRAPWREGRPSLKAFLPEMFFLFLLTSGCVAFAVFASDFVAKNVATPPSSVSFVDALDGWASRLFAEPREALRDAAKSLATSIYFWIWSACLIVPTLLGIGRGCVWYRTVRSVRYALCYNSINPTRTTFRIIRQGFFRETIATMRIGDIKDQELSQSFVQKFFQGGVGTVVLYTTDVTDPVVRMKNMAAPRRILETFEDLTDYLGRPSESAAQVAQGGGSGSVRVETRTFYSDNFVFAFLTIVCFAVAVKWSVSELKDVAELSNVAPQRLESAALVPNSERPTLKGGADDELETLTQEFLDADEGATRSIATGSRALSGGKNASKSLAVVDASGEKKRAPTFGEAFSKKSAKILGIWGGCAVVPAIFWIFKGRLRFRRSNKRRRETE